MCRVGRLRSWRDFARECFCFGSEAVNTTGEAEPPCSLAVRPRGNMAAPLRRLKGRGI